MNEWMLHSAASGVVLSLGAYGLGMWLRKKTGLAWVNPLLISILLCISWFKSLHSLRYLRLNNNLLLLRFHRDDFERLWAH